MGISSWVAHKAVWSPTRDAIRYQGRAITYADFERRVSSVAGYLRYELGVVEGDRVGYLGGNNPAILDLFFACARLGAIFVPLNSRLETPQLAAMVASADPSCLIAGPGFAESATEAWGDRRPDRVIALAEDHTEGLSINSLVGSADPVACDPVRPQDIPVLIAYTSGTTGVPKGAVHTQDSLTFTAINSTTIHNMRDRDNVLTFLPMFHVGGLLIFTLPAIHAGATVTIQEAFDANAVLDEIENNNVSLMLAPPQLSRELTANARFSDADLTSLRCVAIGSTHVPPEVIGAWHERGVPTQQNYGLTEGVPILSSPWEHAERKSDTAGTAVLYTEARVVDDNRQPVPVGQRGEIMIRGRSLFSEYWRNPEATTAAFHDGWFATGDVAFVDDDGYFHIVDRKKNIVIVGSSNVYPADLERILDEHPAILESAVVGVPSTETGEALAACVRLAAGRDMTEAAVRALFDGQLAPYQHPRHLLFMDDFPRTALGKVQKGRLAEAVAAIVAQA